MSAVVFACGYVVSVSSGCFGWATFFCCCAPSAFHVVVFQKKVTFCVHCIYKESKKNRLIGLKTSYSVSFLLFNTTSGCIALLGFP